MLIERLKTAQVFARKARVTDVASLLTTIIGEAEMVGKSAGNRASTDAEVLTTLKKFEKGQVENLKLFTDRNDYAKAQIAKSELTIIRSFLPAKISDEEIAADIAIIVETNNLPKEQKSMGVVTKALKTKYADQFDGAQISATFKQMYLS
jgi:uncharacterized protein YqeY